MSHQNPRQAPSPSDAVRKRTIWESYAVLPPKTRLNISLALCAIAIAGIVVSDRLEEAIPPPKAAPKPQNSSNQVLREPKSTEHDFS